MNNLKTVFLFIIMIYGGSLYALDKSEYDMKGIKLGMNKKEVIEKFPCKPIIENPYADVPSHLIGNGFRLTCKYVEKGNKEEVTVYLDYNGLAINIHRTIDFSTPPNQDNIQTKLQLKYGEPTSRKGIVNTWGDTEKKYLEAWFMSTGDQLRMLLQDKEQLKRNSKWVTAQANKFYLENSKEASSVDF